MICKCKEDLLEIQQRLNDVEKLLMYKFPGDLTQMLIKRVSEKYEDKK